MSAARDGRRLALRTGPTLEPAAGVVHVESRAPRAAPGRLPPRPRAAGLHRLHLQLLAPPPRAGRVLAAVAALLAACARGDDPPLADRPIDAVDAAPPAVEAFRPGFDPADSASVALAAFLDASVAADVPTDAQLARTACGLGAEPVFPTELLAAYEITGRSSRGDTAVVRAAVVTAAEQNVDRRDPARYVGTVRERRGEWEWDVVRSADGWRVCAGPTFGLHAPDALTAWRPDGASAAAAVALARRLADRARPGAGAAPTTGGQ